MWCITLTTSGVVVVAATAVTCYLRRQICVLSRHVRGLEGVAAVAYNAGRADATAPRAAPRRRAIRGAPRRDTRGS